MQFSIITDTSANLPDELVQKEMLHVIPFSYFHAEQEYKSPKLSQFRAKEFYDLLRSGERITTSQINPQKYVEHLRPLLEQGRDLLFVGMSGGVSASFASAGIAAAQLQEEYPECKIRLVNSLGASLGEGLVVLKAVEYRNSGLSLDEAADLLEEYLKTVYQVFTVDDLMHLRRGGRLSNVSAIAGTLLNLKPLLKGNEEGKIVACDKVRGRKKIIALLVQKYNELAVAPEGQLVGISHGDCPEDAQKLAQLLRESPHPPKDILIVEHEPVTGSYLGPGALALYFESDAQVRLK